MNRVVITGVGAVTSYGLGTDKLWEDLLSARSIIKYIPNEWNISNTMGLYAPLPTLNYKELGFSKMELMQYEAVNLNMLLSVEEAFTSADINLLKVNDKLNSYHLADNINSDRFGVFLGTGIGGIDTFAKNFTNYRAIQNGFSSRLDTFTVAKAMPNSLAAAVGIKLNLHKNINSYAYACSTGTITIGKAYQAIANNLVDIAITGSSEYLDQAGATYNAFLKAKTIITEGDPLTINSPFDKSREGFLFSDGGSGALILESLEHAQKRNANILAEIVGFEESFDGYNMVSGDPSGVYIKQMLETLVEKAKINYSDIDYINAHGTGTFKNDEIEIGVFEQLFSDKTAINSTKSLLGHSIAASGSIEAITTVLSIKNQIIHKNNALEEPISSKLRLVKENTPLDIKYAISNSYAFGGHNGSLLFKKYKP